MKRDQIGVQMYTLREMAARDLDATLGVVAKMGYAGVEFAGFQGHSAEEVRAMLDKYGLKAFAAHIPVTQFEGDLESVVSDLTTIGAPWGIVPWVSPDNRGETFMRDLGLKMNAWGSRLKDAGINFGYHNHDFEFTVKLGTGETLFQTLLNITDPDLVFFELDAFWASVGGYEPDQVINQNASRIRLVHIKDASRDDPRKDVPFGEGVLDWGAILSAARSAGVEYYITEQDNPNPDNPVADVETALRNAEGMVQS
jgi:sugar phosphate isomerase/epimerase